MNTIQTLGASPVETLDISLLVELLDTDCHNEAGETLAALGARAVPTLSAALTRSTGVARQRIIRVLGSTLDESAIPPLADMLYAGDREVRREAARALGNIRYHHFLVAYGLDFSEPRAARS